ncbi:MAG: T9SS type A sorting domain-containing protein [Crocinitomicaceae bacterium]
MKTILLTFTLILANTLAISQVEIYKNGSTTDISGTTVNVTGNLYYYMDFKNATGAAATFNVKRKKIQVIPGVGDYLCWGTDFATGTCYSEADVAPNDPWTAPLDAVLEDQRSGILYSYHVPNGQSGSCTYRYYIMVGGVALDSVDINYTYQLSVETEKQANISVFPNPATDVVNINIENLNGVGSVSIYDIAGKVVSNAVIKNGKNQVNIEALNAGVYFYTIRNNEGIIETKKILIQ